MTLASDRSVMPQIKGFRKNTLLDWEGKIACIIFLPGCNLRCPYCHTSALVTEPGTQPDIPLDEVDDYLEKNHGWIDGVVITGGEPTLHPGLVGLVDHFIALGLQVKLFTNGTRPEVVRELIESGRLASISMDVKGPLDQRYQRAAGAPVDLDAIRESIDAVRDSGIRYKFRTTVCPAILGYADVVETARSLRGARVFNLQQFRPVDCLDPSFENIRPYPLEELRRMAEAAGEFVEQCTVIA
jgi:pyruvate formate lyase activating enzyme